MSNLLFAYAWIRIAGVILAQYSIKVFLFVFFTIRMLKFNTVTYVNDAVGKSYVVSIVESVCKGQF